MNVADRTSSVSESSLSWLEDFLSSELAPYPGRGVTVARMVISATITMLLVMTFRIPSGALGTLYAFLVSRDNLRSTFQSGVTIAISYALGVLFVLSGASIFADQQSARVVWFAGSMFVIFFVLRTLRYSDVATGFAVLIVNALPIWQIPATAEHRVELTLWQTLAAAIGTVVTIAVEVVFHAIYPRDELLTGLDERIETACEVFECYAIDQRVSEKLEEKITQYSIVGTSALRRIIARSRYQPTERDELGATVALVGRLVDLAAASARIKSANPITDAGRFSQIASYLRAILRQTKDTSTYVSGRFTSPFKVDLSPSTFPYLLEMERTVFLLSGVLARHESAAITIGSWRSINAGGDPVIEQRPVIDGPFSLFVEDAFENPSHLTWALRGCLATTLCYITYELLDWRGLSTSVTTCAITALSTTGSSRQKQVLRVGGAIVGGLLLGMGAQIFVLPYLDSIGSFAVLFALVTCIGAWVATSSARLSYFGVQLALAFYLITLQEFAIQTSLTVARDRVLGIFLGLFVMWLVFDRFGGARATTEMTRAFSANLGAMAELFEQATVSDVRLATKRVRVLREEIRTNFDMVNVQSDAVLFEFGFDRERGMAIRELIRDWQPKLRSIYLLALAFTQHRLFDADDPFPNRYWESIATASARYALILKSLASHLRGVNVSAKQIDGSTMESNKTSMFSEVELASESSRIRVSGIAELLRQIEVQLEPLSQEILHTSDWHDV